MAIPLLRKRRRIPAAATATAVYAAPLALAVLWPRTKPRDTVMFAMHQWAFTIAHELPYDDPARLRRRLKVTYPIRADRVIGRGVLPNVRLQRLLSRPGRVTVLDHALTWIHWLWFLVPYGGLAWILIRHNERFPRAARQMAAAFDVGCATYALVPTAPPWWAAENGYTREPVRRVAVDVLRRESGSRLSGVSPWLARNDLNSGVRRLMVEVGESTWRGAWPKMYDALGGNPWAAMPSLHFGSSVLLAILLSEAGPVEGTAGWAYAASLGFALVYLGEHYVIDLAAGVALVVAVRVGERLGEPVVERINEGIQRLETTAHPPRQPA